MKTECRIPTLQIPISSTSNRSLSGSSTSFHSSKSGFKDPMLSSFEEELLSTSFGRSSIRSSSIKRKRRSTGSRATSAGRTRQSLYLSELEPETVADFADRLAQGIVLESIETVLRGLLDSRFSRRDDVPFTTSSPIPDSLLNLADSLSSQVIEDAILSAVEELKAQQQEENSDHSNSTSEEEFSDALDVPCHVIEEFADEVAKQVLDTSVKFIIREMECFKKVIHVFHFDMKYVFTKAWISSILDKFPLRFYRDSDCLFQNYRLISICI